MRHGKAFNHLGRTHSHRLALLSNLSKSLIINKRLMITVAKAKALRQFVEPIITKSKNNTMHSRRMVFSVFQDKVPVKHLFEEIAPKISNRPGGYTRIIKLGNRLGDNAEMCMIELVDYNDTFKKLGKEKAKTRRGRGKGKTKVEPEQGS
jgi:large subunit ribosomal protein L17